MSRQHLRVFVSAIVCASLTFATAGADELDELISALRRSADELSAQPTEQSASMLRLVTELQAAVSRSDIDRAQNAAQQLTANTPVPPGLKAIAERLSVQLPRLLAARSDSFVTEVEAAVARTRKECLSAQKEEDLTPLLRDLSALKQRQPAEGTAIFARAVRKLEAAVKTTEAWMDYLAGTATGNRSRALEALRRVASDTAAYPILPAHEYEQRTRESPPKLNSAADILPILGRVKTLRDVEVAAAEMEALRDRTEDRYVAEIASAKLWFTSFHVATVAFLSGDIGDAWQRIGVEVPSQSGSWYPHALRLRSLLLQELIPRYLKLPAGEERRPDETSADRFRRLISEAAAQGRWEDAHRFALAAATVFFNPARGSSWHSELASAISTFLEARRLEEAGDFAGAILTYERVLRNTADLAPVRETVERLRTLRHTQPTAFAVAHPRLESDRVFQLIGQIERTLGQFSGRLARFEQERAASRNVGARPAPPPGLDSQVTKTELQGLHAKVKELETNLAKASDASARLEKLEVLFGPAAEVLARESDDQKKFRIWLGADFTVYRSALPPKLETRLAWVVRYNGKQVLSRNARNEFAYRYHELRPGNYTVFLTLGGDDAPASNMLDFTISEEQAAKLPDRTDRDFDRDGVSNAVEGDDQ